MSWYPDFISFQIQSRVNMMFQGLSLEADTLRSGLAWISREFNYHRYNVAYQILDDEELIAYYAVDKSDLDEMTFKIIPEKADLATRWGISLENRKVVLVFIGKTTPPEEKEDGQEDQSSGEECQESGQGAEVPGEDGQEARQEVAESRD